MERPLTQLIRPDREPLGLKEYEQAGGYEAARKALKMSPQDVQNAVKASNLRGRGGAGFPTGQKWSFVPMGADAPRPKYLLVNGDEMEPGTFKDRMLLEGGPHQMVEAVVTSAYAIQADIAYIFLRAEYTLAAKRLRQAVADAYAAGYLGKNILGSGYSLELYVHTSAGRYMCGEETGLLNALAGKRANPRTKPPFPQTVGLWGKPSVVNNVETLLNVLHIINRGAEWFNGLSRSPGIGGTKIYGVSGKVKRPGLWELPMGTTAREILEEHAGGMREGFKFRAVIPGGASTEFLLEEHLDVKMDFDSVPKVGSRMGTGTMIVIDDTLCPVGALLNLERFFARESCGWCTPCWGGLQFIVQVLADIEDGKGKEEDLDTLAKHAKFLGPGLTYCALAPGAVEPLQSGLKYFQADFERHIREKRCPWK